MTGLEIVDTAVKIGLGALISAGSAYSLTNLKDRHEERKARRTRTWDLLEATATDVQEFLHAAGRFHARLANVLAAEESEPAVQIKAHTEFENEHGKFFDAFRLLSHSETRLRLLGEQKCCNALSELTEELEARYASPGGFREFSQEELAQGRLAVRAKRDAFFHALSDAYLGPLR